MRLSKLFIVGWIGLEGNILAILVWMLAIGVGNYPPVAVLYPLPVFLGMMFTGIVWAILHDEI